MELGPVAVGVGGCGARTSSIVERRHLNEGILATVRDSTCVCPTCIVQGALQTCV